jgi:hypothetical protein
MQRIKIIVSGITLVYLLLGMGDWTYAKPREIHRSRPINPAQVQIDPNVLQEHQKRFGTTSVVTPPPPKRSQRATPQSQGRPKAVETGVGPMTPVDQLLELPVLPSRVGDYPYQHKYAWGKQKTLKEMMGKTTPAKKGPTR